MPSRRSALPRDDLTDFDAAAGTVAGTAARAFARLPWVRRVCWHVSWRVSWRSFAVLLLVGGPAGAAPAGPVAPLPPLKPAALAAAVPGPQPSRRPALRSAPLPPPRPAELDEARSQEVESAGEEEAPAILVSRTVPDGATSGTPITAPWSVPLPSRKGGGEAAPADPAAGQGSEEDTASGTLPEACAALVAEHTIVATEEQGIPPKVSCGLSQPVRLSAIRLRDGRLVAMKPAAILKCEVVAAVTNWLRDDLAPAIAGIGGRLDAVKVAASYDCRPRNRVAGARMSEHGLGNALDVGGFELGDRRTLTVEKGGLPQPLRTAMKESACRRFATVLGPGSDGYHEDHIHVDLAKRKRDYKLCRWNLDVGSAVAAKKDAPARDSEASTPPAPQGQTSGAPASADAAVPDEASPEAGSTQEDAPPPKAGPPEEKSVKKSSGKNPKALAGKSSSPGRSSAKGTSAKTALPSVSASGQGSNGEGAGQGAN